jgi:hypothetical protein
VVREEDERRKGVQRHRLDVQGDVDGAVGAPRLAGLRAQQQEAERQLQNLRAGPWPPTSTAFKTGEFILAMVLRWERASAAPAI